MYPENIFRFLYDHLERKKTIEKLLIRSLINFSMGDCLQSRLWIISSFFSSLVLLKISFNCREWGWLCKRDSAVNFESHPKPTYTQLHLAFFHPFSTPFNRPAVINKTFSHTFIVFVAMAVPSNANRPQNKSAMTELKYRRIADLNQKLRDDYDRPRCKTSDACNKYHFLFILKLMYNSDIIV